MPYKLIQTFPNSNYVDQEVGVFWTREVAEEVIEDSQLPPEHFIIKEFD